MEEEQTIETKVEQKPDLSQKTVVVLVVLTVLISVLGAFAVLNEVGSIKTQIGTKNEGPSTGQVKFDIVKPGESQVKSTTDVTTGRVAFTVLPPTKK